MPLDYAGDTDKLPGSYRLPSKREQDIVEDSLREFAQLQTYRNVFAGQYEEIAELIDPPSRNTFFYGNFNWPGQKKSERQIDSTGMLALWRFGAILDSLLTPSNMYWHGLRANDDYVMKDRATKLWFHEVTKILFKLRYAPHANFKAQNQKIYQSLGAYGTGGMFIDEFDNTLIGGQRGLRYKQIPLGELFLKENHQGIVDSFIRWFRMTARQCLQKWGEERFPETLRPALKAGSELQFDFIHRVCPRTDYDPDRLDARGKPWASYYICLSSKTLMSEGGYRTFPVAATRYDQTPGDGPYGRSPAMMVLPSLKTLNAEKKMFLKQGHRAADPVLLTFDDGLLDGVSLRPGAMNKGGMTSDGKPLVGVLPTGEIQVSQEMMGEERELIETAFLVDLFKLSLQLDKLPQMTATQVIEIMNQKGILLAPTVGRQESDYLGWVIDRELDVAGSLGLLPPMPPRLREARGSYGVVYNSPLSKAMRAGEAAGFIRSTETVKEFVSITGDPSLLDPFDFDTASRAIADIELVPPDWMSSDQQIAQKRQSRAQAQAIQQKIQALPAQAAMMKAQAAVAKSGGGGGLPPGQLPAEGGPPLQQQLAQ